VSLLRPFNGVVKLCLVTASACFLVGLALSLASYAFPVGSRSVALFVVGCFYLSHGVFELLKQSWSNSETPSVGSRKVRILRNHNSTTEIGGAKGYAAA
jgi:hypothetical protein